MNVYGKLSRNDYWILLARVSGIEQAVDYEGKWDQLHVGSALPDGQQTIGQKLGYAS